MRSTVKALERATPVVLTLHENDDDVQWDGFLDADAVRVRGLMRRSLELTKEAQALQTSQRQLQRLLREHRLASLVVADMLGSNPVDEWGSNVQRWQQITRKHFRPWTLWDCADEIDRAMKEVNAMLWNPDALSTGVSFLGWRDRRVFDSQQRSLKYVFSKDFRGYNMMDFVHGMYSFFTNADLFQAAIMGTTGRSHSEVMQRLSPTMCITRSDERYPTFDVHSLCLVFLVQTDGGFTMCVRSIHPPELQAAINGPKDVWATITIWFKWEPQSDDLQNFRFLSGGYLAGADIGYASAWLVEALVSIVRAEAMLSRRPLLKVN
jgi:hypothetical protein